MLGNALMALAFLVSVSGCYSEYLDFKIRFAQIEGLRTNDRVLFEKNRIGRVESVSYSDEGDYMVDVRVDEPFVKAVTGLSRFFIINDPSIGGRKAVEMVRVGKGGAPIKQGAVVDGTTRFELLLGMMQENAEKTLSDLNRKFNQMSDELKGLPERAEVKEFERYLDELKKAMLGAGTAMREKIQKELLPWLQKEIDRLRERLKKLGREKEAEPLEVKMEELRNI